MSSEKKMTDTSKTTIVLYVPRSGGIFFMQYFAIAPLFTAIMLASIVFSSNAKASFTDMLIIYFMLFVLIFIAFAMLYFPQRYLTKFIFDMEDKSLTKIKRGDVPVKLDLSTAQEIVSKRIFLFPGTKYSMAIEDNLGHSHVIFDVEPIFGGRNWVEFSQRLCKVTGIPIKEELWVEDINGKISRAPQEVLANKSKSRSFKLLIPFALSFVGAVLFRINPAPKSFLIIGLVTVVANVAISFAYALSHKEELSEFGNNYLTIVFATLTLIIPYSFFYLLFAYLLNGFRLPIGQ